MLGRAVFGGVALTCIAACASLADADPWPESTGGASSSGNGGQGGSAAEGGAAGAGGSCTPGMSGPEDCTNGCDDNGNGQTDCEDSACGAYECVALPAGFSGAAILEPEPSCPREWPKPVASGHDSIIADPAACAPCSCVPHPPECAPGKLHLAEDAACNDVALIHTYPTAPGCQDVVPNLPFQTYVQAKPIMLAGSCDPDGDPPMLPDPALGAFGQICAPASMGAGCGDDAVCVRRSESVCVFAPSAESCPGDYPARTVLYGNHTDSRDCTPCSCSPPMGGSCSGTVVLYSDDSCTTLIKNMTTNDVCEKLTNATPTDVGSMKVNVSGSGTASCAPSGGAPTGSVEPTEPTTVCCRQ